MGKRGRPRKERPQQQEHDDDVIIVGEEGPSPQHKYRVIKLRKLEVEGGSSLQSRSMATPSDPGPPPGYMPLDSSSSRPITRTYSKARFDRCNAMTTPSRFPVRNVERDMTPSRTLMLVKSILGLPAEETEINSSMSNLPAEEKLTFGLTQENEATEICQATKEKAVENDTPPSEDVVSNTNAMGGESERPTRSCSLNLTKIVGLIRDHSSDEDEVGSRSNSMIDGYIVKEEAAPVLRKIFLTHGDIAKQCSFSSLNIASCLLERVCGIYSKLEETDFLTISNKELQSMLAEVKDLAAVKIEVGWLHQRLSDIYEAKQLLQDSYTLKERKTRNSQVMETKKKVVDGLKEELAACIARCQALQERIRIEEDEFDAAHSENERIIRNFADTRAKVSGFYKKSLVHDLL